MAATLALVFRTRLRLLPLALALAAAAHDLRRAVARRRQPDDGVDRGAAGADRPGGGLRDPVPGALRRGRARAETARASGWRRGGRRADDRHRRPRDRHRLPGAAAVAGPDGARLRRCCWCSGSCSRWAARSAPASRRSCASRRASRRPPRTAARVLARLARVVATRAREPRVVRGPRLARPRRGARDVRGACSRSGWPWRWSAWRSTRRARWSRTCASSCRQDLQALRDVNVLQDETGVSGEIDVTVRARGHHRPEGDRLDDELPESASCATHGYKPASAAPRSGTRPSCARRCRCPTCSARPTQVQVGTPARRGAAATSRRASSPRTARPPTSPSASG